MAWFFFCFFNSFLNSFLNSFYKFINFINFISLVVILGSNFELELVVLPPGNACESPWCLHLASGV